MSVGRNLYRVGGLARVKGETRFGADLGKPDDLYLACVRVHKAPSRLLGVDPVRALAVPGVVRVFTAGDIPGTNRLGIIPITKDQEFLAHDTVRHAGQAVALVAAETRASALAGALAVEVKLDPLPGVFDPEEALSEGAPLVHPDLPTGNLLTECILSRGDAEAALAGSAVVVEAEYTTSQMEHAALEPEGGRAEYRDGRVVVWACTQNPHYDREDLALFLGVEVEKIRVVQAETGGGFGGKLDLSVQPFLALAAWHLRRPVRMCFTREESFIATAKRHPFRMRFITGADDRGLLTATKVDMLSDTGAFASYGFAVNTRAAVHATGPYFVPNLDIRCRMAYTNNSWNGAMRGFGVPQAALAHEGQMDALARRLGMDPLEIRLLNALRNGSRTATGQLLRTGVGMVQCLERIRPIYENWRRRATSDRNRLEGVGVAAMFYGIGNTGVSNPSTAQLEWTGKGKLILYTGAADIGQGSDTVLRQLAATRLGLAPERIGLCRGDTDRTTSSGATSASRQTYISGNAVLAAADNLEMKILEAAREVLGRRHLDLELKGDRIVSEDDADLCMDVSELVRLMAGRGTKVKGNGKFDPNVTSLDPKTGQGRPYATYAFAAQCARVNVDTASGMTRVQEVAAAHDVGRAVNPRAVMGQICGGVLMGVGMALMEDFQAGRTGNLQDYHIPSSADAPRVTPLIVEEPEETGPFGAKGVGEPALIPTAPAVASAVSHAIGKPMRHLPLSLERIMEALNSSREGDRQ